MDIIEGIVGFLEIGGIGVIGYYWKKIGKKRQMIIDKDTNPARDIYCRGSVLLEILEKHSCKVIDFFDAFQLLNKKVTISMSLFILTVDWLFLLGTIRSKNGMIEKCF